jgi:HTH-type transcriptional regulator / antitoxin HipB
MAEKQRDPYGRAGMAATVRARRRLLGLRQEDLADLAGVSLRFVQALEAGKRSVQLDRVEAVLTVLGLHLTVDPDRR